MQAKNELTRAEAARILRCTQTQVCRFEASAPISAGKLRIRVEERPGFPKRIYLLRSDVLELAQSWSNRRLSSLSGNGDKPTAARGKQAALLYPLFEAEVSLNEIVKRTEIDPLLVRQLYEEWKLPLEEGLQRKVRAKQEFEDKREQRRWEQRQDRRDWLERKAEYDRKLIEAAAVAAAKRGVPIIVGGQGSPRLALSPDADRITQENGTAAPPRKGGRPRRSA